MSSPCVVVAGATGRLGRHVVAGLQSRGIAVRALGRDARRLALLHATETRLCDLTIPASLAGVCGGASAVISCAGAPLSMGGAGRASFTEVDYRGNLRLLADARKCGVAKFVYVSLAGALALRRTEYAQAHERFVSELAASGIPCTVVRPTGFFGTFRSLVNLAARGLLAIPGSGDARTNPIHEADAAIACVDALESRNPQLVLGGPETFTRMRIAEMAFEALGKAPRVRRLPAALMSALTRPVRLWNPRLHGLLEFGLAVSQVDVIAPLFGERRLGDDLRAYAATLRCKRP